MTMTHVKSIVFVTHYGIQNDTRSNITLGTELQKNMTLFINNFRFSETLLQMLRILKNVLIILHNKENSSQDRL